MLVLGGSSENILPNLLIFAEQETDSREVKELTEDTGLGFW